jgi:hypothetical protein
MLLLAEFIATINGGPARFHEPTRHSLQEKVFYVICAEAQSMKL